jgi:hypothetical protein
MSTILILLNDALEDALIAVNASVVSFASVASIVSFALIASIVSIADAPIAEDNFLTEIVAT